MNLSILFGKKLKEIRESKGLTQQKLAELCDMQTNSIGMIEIGKRAASFSTLELLAEKLDVNISDLFDFSADYDIEKSENKLICDIYRVIKDFDSDMLQYVLSNAKSVYKLCKKVKY